MAPRTAKAKKATDTTKGRGKAKLEEENGVDMKVDVNGSEGKVGKKLPKKETDTEKIVEVEDKPKVTRGRKNARQKIENVDNEDNLDQDEIVKEKSKPAKGRGKKAQPKKEDNEKNVEGNQETDENPDEVNQETHNIEQSKKSKKKLQTKSKEKTPESEEIELVEKVHEMEEKKDDNEPQTKKEGRGKKNQGKKAAPKEEQNVENDDEEEEPAPKKKKTKKVEKGDKEKDNEEEAKVKPKGKRGAKKAVEVSGDNDDAVEVEEPINKRQRKLPEEKAAETKKKAPPKNKTATNYEDIDFSNSSKNEQGKPWNFKISSWNVDGIRAWMTKGGLDYISYEKPDILCLQEVKCSKDKLPDEILNVPGYHAYWLCSDQDGYAGVGIYTTKLAISVEYGLQNKDLDNEGRVITAEYEHFYLICTYVPNAGRKLVTLPKRLQWNEEFRKYVKELDKKKPVIICGDMNVAHNEIDLTNPKTNKKNAGFTEEERTGMTELLSDGFVDTYRLLNPDETGAYTFWTYMMNSRAKNIGWRLDYFILSERLLPALCDNVIRSDVYGSDHCPITLFLHLSTADKPKESPVD